MQLISGGCARHIREASKRKTKDLQILADDGDVPNVHVCCGGRRYQVVLGKAKGCYRCSGVLYGFSVGRKVGGIVSQRVKHQSHLWRSRKDCVDSNAGG